jgi:carboxylate-amine ligase
MLLDAETLTLAPAIEEVLAALPQHLRERATSETHASVAELATGVHATVDGAATELARLRGELAAALDGLGLRAASAGTHPTAVWQEVAVSSAPRHRAVEDAMRVLARREPTLALHVHVGVPTPTAAIGALNQLRAHLPILLALSGNSPFWQGRDTGLASARTPLFQAFPRVGIPRAFASYADWAHAVDLLVRCDALPDHTHLWWDVRLNPVLGTVEVRVMDAQTRVADAASLVALVQCLVRLEVVEGWASWRVLGAREVLEENRFLAARDGVSAELINLDRDGLVPVRALAPTSSSASTPSSISPARSASATQPGRRATSTASWAPWPTPSARTAPQCPGRVHRRDGAGRLRPPRAGALRRLGCDAPPQQPEELRERLERAARSWAESGQRSAMIDP